MRSRRSISSVVGMVFALIALTTTITYISYSMGILNNYNQSVLTKNQQLSDVDKERFQISSVTIPSNNKLNITIANTGSLPINFTKIWVQNKTATDWVNSYTSTNNFVSPGGILTNMGQNIPVSINPSNSYNVKLVTSRGNTQQFTVNSIGAAPLKIQFYSFPSTIPSEYTTELVMIVTNNQSSTLANLVPQITEWTSNPSPSNAICSTSATPSPASVSTLAPGSTAVFKWDLQVTGSSNQFCTYIASLKNGYPGNTASATVTIRAITATSSNWSTTWGILSINYTSLQWTQDGNNWNNAWSITKTKPTVWRVTISNNDPTRNFIFNENSVLLASSASSGAATGWWIIPSTYPPLVAYPSNSQTILANSTSKIYFGSNGPMSPNSQNAPTSGQYGVSILLYGYWNSVSNSNFFGQNIPYEGIVVS